jgi:hypothetical protein
VQRDLGVRDTAIAVFSDRYGCWGLLDLWRTTGPAFTTVELALLEALADPLTTGLRRAFARTFVDAGEQLLPPGPAVVVLRPDLQVRTVLGAADAGATRSARSMKCRQRLLNSGSYEIRTTPTQCDAH